MPQTTYCLTGAAVEGGLVRSHASTAHLTPHRPFGGIDTRAVAVAGRSTTLNRLPAPATRDGKAPTFAARFS